MERKRMILAGLAAVALAVGAVSVPTAAGLYKQVEQLRAAKAGVEKVAALAQLDAAGKAGEIGLLKATVGRLDGELRTAQSAPPVQLPVPPAPKVQRVPASCVPEHRKLRRRPPIPLPPARPQPPDTPGFIFHNM